MRLNKKNKRKQANLKRKFANDVKIDVPVSGKDKMTKFEDHYLQELASKMPPMLKGANRNYRTTVLGSTLIDNGIKEVMGRRVNPRGKYTKSQRGKAVDHLKTLRRVNNQDGISGVEKYCLRIQSVVDAHNSEIEREDSERKEAKQVESPTS